MEKVTCVACKHETDTPIKWEQVSRGFPLNLKTKEFEDDTRFSDYSEHENFACPECGSPYDNETEKKLLEVLI